MKPSTASTPIDMVVVNLYPFEAHCGQSPTAAWKTPWRISTSAGPTMVRAAAKNHRFVNIVVNADGLRGRLLDEMRVQRRRQLTLATRFDLAVQAPTSTPPPTMAPLPTTLANRSPAAPGNFPRTCSIQYRKAQDMRYGENPHQGAAFYVERDPAPGSVATVRQLQGKALSYNNVADTDAALECVKSLDVPACVIVKHANPCGAAVATDIRKAYELAFATDSESAFGGIIAFNRELDADTAAAIVERQFVEVIIAPTVAEGALAATGDQGKCAGSRLRRLEPVGCACASPGLQAGQRRPAVAGQGHGHGGRGGH